MRAPSLLPRPARPSVWLLPLLLMACQSSPAELYLLSPQTALVQNEVAAARVATAPSTKPWSNARWRLTNCSTRRFGDAAVVVVLS